MNRTADDIAAEMDMSPETIRELGYRITDLIVHEFEDLSRRPIYPPPKSFCEMESHFGGPPPCVGTDPHVLLDVVRDQLLPASTNYNHPRLTGYISSTTLPLSGLIEALVSTVRVFPYTWSMTPVSSHVEATVGRWLGQMVGFSDDAAGYITTGDSWANLMGIAIARVRRCGWYIKMEGLAGHPTLVAYCSEQAHSCIEQSMRLLGIGSAQLRRIPVDEAFRIRIDELERAVAADLAAGRRPFCLIGTAGTTNTGAVDPLEALADVAACHEMWFHIDGAYGAFAALDEETRPILSGFSRADSLVLDPHKWLNIPYEAGCFLTRSWRDMADTFALVPEYLVAGNTESREHNHWQHGFELTRGDRALKIWIALRQYGVDTFSEMVSGHIALARRVGEWVEAAPDFEVASAPALSVCGFRYVPTDVDPDDPGRAEYLDSLNEALEEAIIADGRALVTGTRLAGKKVLRVCIVNHRITWGGLRETLELLRELGAALHARGS